jgi:hypothetical protein
MLNKEHLKDLFSLDGISTTDKVLLCLAVEYDAPKAVKDITAMAFASGFRGVKKLNVSDILRKSNGLAIRVDAGWELSTQGLKHVQQIAGPLMNSPIPKVASSLRTHLAGLSKETAAFVEEAIACFETRQFRAATVLSWVGAVSVLYHHVVAKELATFNAAATKHFTNPKNPWRIAKTADDLARMKEADFLLLLEKISVIGKNVRQQLDAALTLRNGCGHPNSYKLGEHKVSSHIEDLILNVFSKF